MTRLKTLPLLRHRFEFPLLILSLLISLAAFALAIELQLLTEATWRSLGISNENRIAITENIAVVLLVPLLPALLWLQRAWAEAKIRVKSLEVDRQQFPALHGAYTDLLARLDLPSAPALLISSGEIPKPWFSAAGAKPRLVLLTADMAALTGEDTAMRDFFLAQELARFRLKHTGLWRATINFIPRLLIVPGFALARAEEYSADAVAASLLPQHALDYILFSGFGKGLYHSIDKPAYRAACARRSRPSAEHWISEKPLLFERYLALCRQLESSAANQPPEIDGRLF